jgi:hypothetical protein
VTALSVYVCMLVYLCSRVFLFASYSFPLCFFLPSQFISYETQALHLRKEFLKTPSLLAGVIHTTNNRKDIWLLVDVAVQQPCFHTGCFTYVLTVLHHVHWFWRLQVTCSFRESFQTFLLHFPGVSTRTSLMK